MRQGANIRLLILYRKAAFHAFKQWKMHYLVALYINTKNIEMNRWRQLLPYLQFILRPGNTFGERLTK